MEALVSTTLSNPHPPKLTSHKSLNTHFTRLCLPTSLNFSVRVLAETRREEEEEEEDDGNVKRRYKWGRIGPHLSDAQKKGIAELSPKMTNRCKAVMKQIICYCDHTASLGELLGEWVRIMKPRRSDWLVVLKHLNTFHQPIYLQAAEVALLEESFEANVRDYTKIIHSQGKQSRLKDAQNTLAAMKAQGLIVDQVILTAFIDMYSKAGHLTLAQETFEDIKLLGELLDKRSYGSMIMAYIRAGRPDHGETLLREMDSQEIYAGPEIYKALLRAYSMAGDVAGTQRVFEAIQLARITPDAKICGLLINAYVVAGLAEEARAAFENMRRVGLEPSDKCVALVLLGYEKEGEVQRALEFLIELERDGVMIGKEASEVLVSWFRKLGVVKEVELVLRDFANLSMRK